MASWRFNTGLTNATLLVMNASASESWSDYALEMSGQGPAIFALPENQPSRRPNLNRTQGTLRFWFSPVWSSSAVAGGGPGAEARLLEVGAWSAEGSQGAWTLGVSPEGNELSFTFRRVPVLSAPIAWRAGSWHQVALSWSPDGIVFIGEDCSLQRPEKRKEPGGESLGVTVFTHGESRAFPEHDLPSLTMEK